MATPSNPPISKVSLMQSILLAAATSGVVETSAGGLEKLLSVIAIPLMMLALVLAGLFLVKKMANLYYKVPPNKALVVFGKGKQQIVTGGAKLLVPLLNDWFEMDLSAFQVTLELKNAPNKDRVPINVKAVATVCIGEDEELLANAARKFGRKTQAEIERIAHATLEGQFRQVISQTDMETILSERSQFNATTQETAGKELSHLGFKLLMLNLQEITDDNGYIIAQGKPKIAEVKAEAEIRTAEQTRRQTVETSTAQREAAVTKAANDAQTADAERDLNKRKAVYDGEVATERAKAEQAGPLATAVASQAVRVAVVDSEEAETKARIKLQGSVAELTEAELKATVIKKAEADARAKAIEADGVKAKKIIEANADGEARNIAADAGAKAAAKEAEAAASKIRTVGTAESEMTAMKGQADADAKKANLLAEADGETAKAGARKALLLAEAEGATAQANATKARLLAEAEGARALNEAYTKLSPEAQKLFLATRFMETGPALIAAVGEAMQKALEPIAQSLTSSLGSIDSITVYDAGSGNGGALDRAVSVGPDMFFKLITNLKANGLYEGAAAMLKAATGIDIDNPTPVIEAEAAAVTGDATKKDAPIKASR
ncbi:MAG: hypothetical protein KBC02_03155 [Candidatus Pacebacteria bacterium]|nr:hypothetical protein [Candidatus Paceibacterota bacterium]